MATFTVTGFKIRSDGGGGYSYLGAADLILTANDNFQLIYDYLSPGSGGAVNDFGISEIEILSFPYDAVLDGKNIVNDEDIEATVFQLNLSGGDTAQMLTMYDPDSDIDHIFIIGGSETNPPTSQSQLNSYVSSITSAQTIADTSLPNVADMANVAVNNADLYFASRTEPLEDVGLDFGDGDDAVYTFAGDYSVNGGDGNDRIVANGAENAFLAGGDGNDIMKFKGGTEGSMYGMDGDDKLVGDTADDYMEGGTGSDILLGLAGNDILYGRSEELTDPFGDPLDPATVSGDFLYGGRGNDFLYGNVSDDVLRGNRDQDTLYGYDGVDRMYGGGGNDQLFGGDGADFLLGENGNDTFDSGAGNDRMTGGAGADTFVIKAFTDYDTILDFTQGEDKIDLTQVTAAAGMDELSDVLGVASDRASGVRLDLFTDTTVLLVGVLKDDLTSDDFLF